MLCIIVKYFFIILCSVYIFLKLQNKTVSKKQNIINLLFSIASSILIYFVRKNLVTLTIISIVVLLIIFLQIFYRNPLVKTINYTTIAFGISYFIYTISTIVMGIACFYIFYYLNPELYDILSLLIIGLFQMLLSYLLFKIKRFKNGLSAYESNLNIEIGVCICLLLLFFVSMFSSQNIDSQRQDFIGTMILIFVLIISFLLMLWWKKHISNIYLEKVYKRNTEILENSLSEQQKINQELKKSNEELSNIIHRDNKMIPAMESAVEEILKCKSADEQKEKSNALLCQLKSMASERDGIITDYENQHKSLPPTGIFSLDASLKYLMNRALKDNIFFDLSVTSDIRSYANAVISENDLNTLILDLGENALIAVRETKKRNVLVVLGTECENFVMSIYDSGLMFEQKVIENLGKRRITTHKETGGSGIGLMTTFELLRKYKASFDIDETVVSENYVKKVSVIFDGLSQCRITAESNKIVRQL